MDTALIAALLTGLLGLLGVLLNHILQNKYEKRVYLPLSKERVQAVCGTWEGESVDIDVPDDDLKKYKVTATFEKNQKYIQGIYEICKIPDGKTHKFNIIGGFYNDSYLKFDYKNIDESLIHFGVILLKISSNGKHLTGKYLGYGSQRRRYCGR